MDTATGIIRLIQGVIPGAMARTNTFDKVGSCLSMLKTHHRNFCLDSKKKICSLKYRVDFPYLLFVRIFNPFGADGG